ncbi:MAG: tail fiber protein [Caudoviricetes sp.]|nr:MAG: tail fiber protein [Caudoviricetes sp.]
MSVPVQVPISGPYTANGSTTQFAYQFYVLLATDIDVFVGGVKKLLNTDYTVTQVGNTQGGNVVMTVAPASGLEVIIKRNTPFTRQTDYADNGDLLADVLNADIDRLWLALQEINANFGSSISRPVGGNWTAQNLRLTMLADGTQPQDAVTFNQLYTVNGNAAAAAQAAATSAQTAAGFRDAAGQSATNAATSETNSGNSATLAQKWAANPVDMLVANGLYSAMHYATKASGSATNAATSENNSATNAQQTAQDAINTASNASNAATSASIAQTEAAKLGNMNALAAAINSVTGNNVVWKGVQNVLTEGAADGDLVTVRQLRAATAGSGQSAALINGVLNNFIGAFQWSNYTSRTTLPAGHLAADGQLLNRADYPELWAAINAGILVSVSDTTWLNTAGSQFVHRAKFSTGNGSTTFRLPDLNGKTAGSIIPFPRGDGGGTAVGTVYDSGAPNITGSLGFHGQQTGGSGATVLANASGSLVAQAPQSSWVNASSLNSNNTPSVGNVSLDASRSSAVYGNANEVRPQMAVGIWLIRVNGSFTAANTNFNVFNGATAAPANGVTVNGGLVRSAYQVNGTDYATAELRAKVIGGTSPARSVVLDIGDNANGRKTWEFTDQGDISAPTAAWQNVTFQNSWSNTNGTTKFRKFMGMVQLKVMMSGGAPSTTAFTLPAGYRPNELTIVPCGGVQQSTQSGPPRLQINASGAVAVSGATGGGDAIYGFVSFPIDA